MKQKSAMKQERLRQHPGLHVRINPDAAATAGTGSCLELEIAFQQLGTAAK